MVEKKEDGLIKSQGMYFEFDGIKFQSKEDLESYKKSPKKSEKEISEEKIVEDAKAEADRVAEEKAEADGVTEEKAEADGVTEEIAVSKKFYIKQYIWLIIFTILWVGIVRGNFQINRGMELLTTLEATLFVIVSNGFIPTLIIGLIRKIFKRPAWKWYNWLNTLGYTVLVFNWMIFLKSLGGFFAFTNIIPSPMLNFMYLGI